MAARNVILISIASFLISANTLSAQEESGHEESGAVIVLDENEFQAVSDKKGRFRKHRIVQVYRGAGVKYGHVVVEENQFVRCKSLTGKIMDMEGNLIVELGREDAEKGPLFPEYVLYADSKYNALKLGLSTFPYVVEYTCEQEYDSLLFWPEWRPQEDVPVRRSTYRLTVSDKIDYRSHAIGMDLDPQTTPKRGKTELLWELANIPPKVKEQHMSPEDQVQMALYFAPTNFVIDTYTGSFASWDGVAGWYSSLASGQDNLPPEAKQHILQLVSAADSDVQKVQKLYAFLQDHTRYVAKELGIGAWQPYSAGSVFNNRYGDCKDLSTLMIAMLKVVGIQAYPALIRTRNRGVLIREFPANQFNHCITCVPLEEDTIWLECTQDFLPAGELPALDEGCDVLVVRGHTGKIVRTPQSSHDDNLQTSRIEGRLTSLGTLEFSGKILVTGNISAAWRGRLNHRKPEDRKRWLERLLGGYLPGLNLTTLNIDHLDRDFEKPVIIRFEGESGKFGVQSAQRLFVNPNILNRKTPEDMPREKDRKFPFHHPFASSSIDSMSIFIPSGFDLEAAPRPQEIVAPFGHFTTAYAFSNGKLEYSRTFRCERTHIPLSMYQDYVSFLQNVVKADGSQFVFVQARKR